MQTIRFGRTGVTLPTISLGTWGHGGPNMAGPASVGWSGHDDALASHALVRAHEAGIIHWDTADVYGNGHAEILIGQAFEHVPRSAIFLATKVGWDPGTFGHFYHPTQIRNQLERSLRNLRVDSVDLYYLHHCDFGPDGKYFEDAIELLRRFREEGKIRFIGLSDWSSEKIMEFVAAADPDVVQPYRNVLDDTWEASGLKQWTEDHDIGVAFFSPLKHGLLLGKYDKPVEFPEGDFRSGIADFGDQAILRKLRDARDLVAKRFGNHPEPVMHAIVGALLTDTPTGCVLLGQRNPAQVDAAAAIGDALCPEDALWVKEIYRRLL